MAPKRATIYFEPDLHKALRLKAAELDSSLSDLVNDALKAYFREDAEDMAAVERRKHEPSISFEEVIKKLKKSGKI